MQAVEMDGPLAAVRLEAGADCGRPGTGRAGKGIRGEGKARCGELSRLVYEALSPDTEDYEEAELRSRSSGMVHTECTFTRARTGLGPSDFTPSVGLRDSASEALWVEGNDFLGLTCLVRRLFILPVTLTGNLFHFHH